MPFPFIPLAIGAGLGGASALFKGGGLFGSNVKNRQVSQYSPGAQQGMDWLLQQGRQNADWGPIEQRARQQFSQSTIPSIAERFTSLGDGAQESSAFGGELGGAASDLESQLAALRSQYGLQQMQIGLRPQFENYMEPGQAGAIEGMIGGATQAMSPWLAGLFNQGQRQQPTNNQQNLGQFAPKDQELLAKLMQYLSANRQKGGL